MNHSAFNCLTGILMLGLAAGSACSKDAETSVQDTHLMLRNETARRYLNPESHLKLARFHYDQGHKVQAFYISEWARSRFGDDAFTPVFDEVAAVKLQTLHECKTETEWHAYIEANPKSLEAEIDKFRTAHPLDDSQKLRQLQANVEALAARFTNTVYAKGALASFYLKKLKDKDRAFPLYIELYFYDPHYYDGEFAEFRVKSISRELKGDWWMERKRSGKSFVELVRTESNPRVLDVAIDEASRNWNKSLVPAFFVLLDNDDPTLQSRALHILMDHPKALAVPQVKAMLADTDLVKRAMAALLFVKCASPEEYPLLQANLDSGIQLVQMDTIQALGFIAGPDGYTYLAQHKPAKASAGMTSYWEYVVARKGKMPQSE